MSMDAAIISMDAPFVMDQGLTKDKKGKKIHPHRLMMYILLGATKNDVLGDEMTNEDIRL